MAERFTDERLAMIADGHILGGVVAEIRELARECIASRKLIAALKANCDGKGTLQIKSDGLPLCCQCKVVRELLDSVPNR